MPFLVFVFGLMMMIVSGLVGITELKDTLMMYRELKVFGIGILIVIAGFVFCMQDCIKVGSKKG